jgi:hypothetical protein
LQLHKEKEMADLRRWIIALAVLVVFSGLASAQISGGGGTQLICSVNTSATPTLRSEGITEEVGDIVITCTGGTPLPSGASIPLVNITVSLTSQVTSRLVASGNVSEALLMLDEPNSGLPALVPGYGPGLVPFSVCSTPTTGCQAFSQTVTSPVTGLPTQVANTTAAAPFTPAPSVFQGVVGGNQVTFFGVPINPPGTTSSRVIRVTNVRTNANGIGGGSASGSIPVQASILTSNFAALPISNATPIVGFVQASLSTTASAPFTFAQCIYPSATLATSTILTYKELFGSAFKTRVDPRVTGNTTGQSGTQVQTMPGVVYNSESGFTLSATSSPPATGFTGSVPAGLADFGTRLQAVFNNIPAGTRLFVSLYGVNVSGNTIVSQNVPSSPTQLSPPTAELVSSGTVSDGSSFPSATPVTPPLPAPVQVVEITPASGSSATAVWEVLTDNINAIDTLQFGVFLFYTPSPGTNSPAAGTGTVNMSYGPTSTVTSASSSATIPRFVDTSSAKNAISIAICRTVLMFPFITNQLGFDTGLAIANTSTDPFGTTPQNGSCTANYYGANAPPAGDFVTEKSTPTTITSGTAGVTLASTVAPGFQGYMIATCSFQFAHGFAFVSDVGARNLAMGYLALIIPDPSLNGGRGANTSSDSALSSGEQLDQ